MARIYTKNISLLQIEPDPNIVVKLSKELKSPEYEKWLWGERSNRLLGFIFAGLQEKFLNEYKLWPTEAEKQEFVKAMTRRHHTDVGAKKARLQQIERELRASSTSPARKKQLAQESVAMTAAIKQATMAATALAGPGSLNSAAAFVGGWKFNRALYKKYGGKVIIQEAGFEPVGAYEKWLREHEMKGSFKILEPKLRGRIYESLNMTAAPVDPGDFFETPWWLKAE